MSSEEHIAPEVDVEGEQWDSPVEHFRPRKKLASVFVDRQSIVKRFMDLKTSVLSAWYLPTITPMYFFSLHFSQRNRNLFLLENHLNYRPYKWRRNDYQKY